jgi:hypothetical protein
MALPKFLMMFLFASLCLRASEFLFCDFLLGCALFSVIGFGGMGLLLVKRICSSDSNNVLAFSEEEVLGSLEALAILFFKILIPLTMIILVDRDSEINPFNLNYLVNIAFAINFIKFPASHKCLTLQNFII